jgi:hypothetical protein
MLAFTQKLVNRTGFSIRQMQTSPIRDAISRPLELHCVADCASIK